LILPFLALFSRYFFVNGGFAKLFQSFHETSCRPKENGREHKMTRSVRSEGSFFFV